MLTWLADVLRAANLPVIEIAGWKTRGHGEMVAEVRGVLLHHTAGPAAGNYPSLGVVRDGRPGLEGPLANLGLGRDGSWIVIAAGQAWHAGTGSYAWCPRDQGNRYLIGVEAESVGTRDDWTPAQRENYPRGVAALLEHLGLPAERVIGHKEWAPSRKIDPAFWDLDQFRRTVASLMTVLTGAGGTDDMALNEHDIQTLVARLLAAQVPDRFPATVTRNLSLQDTFVWAAANAGRAEAQAKACRKELAAIAAHLGIPLPNTGVPL